MRLTKKLLKEIEQSLAQADRDIEELRKARKVDPAEWHRIMHTPMTI